MRAGALTPDGTSPAACWDGPWFEDLHPALVCDVATGQSTTATRRVIANLFYRGPVLRRAVLIGERLDPLVQGGGIAHLRARVHAAGERGERGERRAVLDWRFAAVLA